MIPGLVIIALFMGYVIVWSLLHPRGVPDAQERLSFLSKIKRSGRLIPAVLLIVSVIGSIYTGAATPTEAAVIGVAGSLVLAAVTGTLTWTTLRESVVGGMRTSVLIMLIIAGASILSALMDYSGLPQQLARSVKEMNLSAAWLLFWLAILYLILGCFLDGVSMIVATASVVLPMVSAANIDLVWFGIYLIVLIEIAQITPPVGFNLYILQALTGKDIMVVDARLGAVLLPAAILPGNPVAVAAIGAFPAVASDGALNGWGNTRHLSTSKAARARRARW